MDVSREITLPVDPQDAWDAVTDLERWLTDAGSLELQPGAAGELTLRDGETRWATVADVRVGEHLSFWWHAPDALRRSSRSTSSPSTTGRASSSSRAATPARRSAGRRGRAARATVPREQRRGRDGVAELPARPCARAHDAGLGTGPGAPAAVGGSRRGVAACPAPPSASRRSSPRSPIPRGVRCCARSPAARPGRPPSSPRACRSAARRCRSTSRSSRAPGSSTASASVARRALRRPPRRWATRSSG